MPVSKFDFITIFIFFISDETDSDENSSSDESEEEFLADDVTDAIPLSYFVALLQRIQPDKKVPETVKALSQTGKWYRVQRPNKDGEMEYVFRQKR